MNTELLCKQFGRIGARLLVSTVASQRQNAGIDIAADTRGEYFDIRTRPTEAVEYDVVDVQPKLRHLLLLARRQNSKEKYLCGHDERHWFVCAIPERPGVAGVVQAMEALQPAEVRAALGVVRAKNRLRRHNAAFIRQGEWFFVPAFDLQVNQRLIHSNEPIRRGNGGKPHWCQFLFRQGGETVMVCRRHPNGLGMDEYQALVQVQPDARNWGWRAMRRNAAVYARDRVSHPDHQTVVLTHWHRVLMNTEDEAPGKRNVVFLD